MYLPCFPIKCIKEALVRRIGQCSYLTGSNICCTLQYYGPLLVSHWEQHLLHTAVLRSTTRISLGATFAAHCSITVHYSYLTGSNICCTLHYYGPQLVSHWEQHLLHTAILRSTTLLLTKTGDQTHKCVSSALPTYSQFCLNRESKQAR